MLMPAADPAILEQRAALIEDLRRILPHDAVIVDERSLKAFECDGLTAYRQVPMVAVLPSNTEQVAAILALCHRRGVNVVPRGAGTSLSGGALPLADGVLMGMGKFNRVLDID